ncbi:hypothetical protein BLNAU_6085 [Blattamonas nauphoetae]|uniref:Uncharacterized protein n=1 Tax=Blattamonas nauphoetae TaxID=2049346 RepID=A0ABQ9Y520_9EUKA|nr:hypothetical protein BLNAU_6085 [Blattamonas nauphoetae]
MQPTPSESTGIHLNRASVGIQVNLSSDLHIAISFLMDELKQVKERLNQVEETSRKREEDLKMTMTESTALKAREQELIAQFRLKEEEMQKTIAVLTKNQRPNLVIIPDIRFILSGTSGWIQSGNRFTRSSDVKDKFQTVTLDHIITTGIWQLTLFISKQSTSFVIGLFDPNDGHVPDDGYPGGFGTSVGFSIYYKNVYTHRKGDSKPGKFGDGHVVFRAGDEVVLEADMKSRTCHLFVNSEQTKVFVRNIPKSIKFAISVHRSEDGFGVRSLREVEVSQAVPQTDDVAVDL